MPSLRRIAVLALGVALVVALTLAPSVGAKPKHKGSIHDLAIKEVTIKHVPGNPKYLLLDHNSRAGRLEVTVTTFNYGAHVGPTNTDVQLELNGKVIRTGRADVPPLDYRDSVSHTWKFDGQQADPGLLEVVATADATHKITETKEGNNIKAAPIIDVIPQDWNVGAFQANVDLGNGLTGGTYTDNGFFFHFSDEDEAAKEFVYTASGAVKANTSFNDFGCSGQGTSSATQPRWPGADDGLTIKTNLSQYSAGVKTDTQPGYPFQVSCGGAAFQEQGSWANLVTWKNTYSWIPMSFSATTLTDSGEVDAPQGHTKYAWTFNAAISGA